jgi:hypothetical protein
LPAGVYVGWATATLAIQGLQSAGKSLTSNSFLNALHSQKAYTAGGLQMPTNLAQNKQGTYAAGSLGNCQFAMKITGTKFVPLALKPFCTPK